MKTLRQLILALLLTLTLTQSALAGEIHIPAPAPPASSSETTTPGDAHMPGIAQPPESPSDPVTEVAMSLLQTVLSIF